jgi:hypothetical protein
MNDVKNNIYTSCLRKHKSPTICCSNMQTTRRDFEGRKEQKYIPSHDHNKVVAEGS